MKLLRRIASQFIRKKVFVSASYSLLTVTLYLLLYAELPEFLMVLIFTTMFVVFLFVLFRFLFQEISGKFFLFLMCIQIGIIAFLSRYILNIELWGDEVGVLIIAEQNFANITHLVTGHAAALPFDYWMIYLWMKITQSLQYPIFFQEIVLRIPYLFFHGLSGMFFLGVVKEFMQKEEKIKHIHIEKSLWYFTCIFLLYFLNPLLLFYAIEVRFYAFAVLGTVVTLYLYLKNRLFTLPGFFLSMIFCLNSVYQFLIVFPLLLISLLKHKQGYIFFQCIVYAFLLFFTQSRLNYYDPVSTQESIRLILRAIDLFWQSIFVNSYQSLSFLIITIFLLWKKKKWPYILMVSIAYIAIVSTGTAYLKKYFDFYIRHYLVAVPMILLLIIYPTFFVSKNKKFLLMTIFTCIFLIPWFFTITQILSQKKLLTKGNLQAKDIAVAAKKLNSSVLFLKPENESDRIDSFSQMTFDWYLEKYEVSAETLEETTQYCMAQEESLSIYVTFMTQVECLEMREDLQRVELPDSPTRYYLPKSQE